MALQVADALALSTLGVVNDTPPDLLQPRLVDAIHLRWSFGVTRAFPWHGYYLLRRIHREAKVQCLRTSFTSLPEQREVGFPQGTFSSDVPFKLCEGFDPPGFGELDLRERKFVRFAFAPAVRTNRVTCQIGLFKTGSAGKPIRVRTFAGSVLLEDRVVSGTLGQITSIELRFDAITGIEVTGGNGAIVDLCFEDPSAKDITTGWAPVPDCPQPMALPVRHADYPASGGLPTNIGASENEAVGRIRYGDPDVWRGSRFQSLHEALIDLVHGGPGGPPMQDVGPSHVVGTSADDQAPPTLQRLASLKLLLAGALYAPFAQMLGLYWADRKAEAGKRYDYMVVADHTNVGKRDVNTLLTWLAGPEGNFTDIDAWVAYDLVLQQASPLDYPVDLKAYALPGGTIDLPDGTIRDATNNAGLTWTRPFIVGNKLAGGAPIMYHLRRASVGMSPPPGPVPVPDHIPISPFPQVVAAPASGALGPSVTPEHAADWPPFAVQFLDTGLQEGWYSYRVHSVDIFGRYSKASEPAAWHQWTPVPDPPPWYYDPALGDGVVNANAVSLLDKLPPPPPTAVEALALDPADPFLVRDAAYQAWFATLSAPEQATTLGLRVSWRWTYAQMRQAPDTSEFRVYYHPGHLNTLVGHVTDVVPAGDGTAMIVTDIPNSEAAGAYVGGYLRSNGQSFPVLASIAGTPLRVTVKALGPEQLIVPASGADCVIALTPGMSTYRDYSRPPTWQQRVRVVPYPAAVEETVAPSIGSAGEPLQGSGATASGFVATFPAGVDFTAIRAFATHVHFAGDTARSSRTYFVHSVDPGARKLTLDAAPALPGGVSDWTVGTLVRRYEVFLPAPGDADRSGLPLATSVADPIVYAQIGVTAVDDKTHTPDDPARTDPRWGGRKGNESRIGGPSTVFRVHREAPPAPGMAPDSDAVFASRADYHASSYYTFRWIPQANVDTHVFRAVDSGVFARDWRIRSTRSALSATAAAHASFFPAEWSAAKRTAAATQLNAITDPGSYAALSIDARNVLGRLPGNEGFTSRGGIDTRDWLVRRTRSALATADVALFPVDWAVSRRNTAAIALNGITAPGSYAALGNDPLRILAGLPGNEAPFQQVTVTPLPNSGPTTANRRGPDNSADFVIDPSLRAHVDRLDGRSTNRYFYRCAFVDRAQNLGGLGVSSPPVHMRDVVPPRAPVFTRVLAGDTDLSVPGDGKITLRWSSNREKDLALYRVYRTSEEANARDVRLMELVQEVPVPAGEPLARPAEVAWVDATVQGLITYHYRLIAVDASANPSSPSTPLAARAFDTSLPDAPAITVVWVPLAGVTHAQLTWTSQHEVMIQRREVGGPWIDLAQWRSPGTVTVRDPFSYPHRGYQYRALVRKSTGALRRGTPIVLAPQTEAR